MKSKRNRKGEGTQTGPAAQPAPSFPLLPSRTDSSSPRPSSFSSPCGPLSPSLSPAAQPRHSLFLFSFGRPSRIPRVAQLFLLSRSAHAPQPSERPRSPSRPSPAPRSALLPQPACELPPADKAAPPIGALVSLSFPPRRTELSAPFHTARSAQPLSCPLTF